MDINSTEEQQVEAIKSFLRENGMSIVVGAVLGLGLIFGWRYYNDSRLSGMETASQSYENWLDTTGLDKEAAMASGQTFVDENKGSSYADFAAMTMAKTAVEQGDMTSAAEQLSWVVANTGSAQIKAVAAIRLARVLNEQGETDQALLQLQYATAESYTALVEEVRGDILLKQEKQVEALAAYQAAADAGGLTNNPILQMKMDDLTVAEQI